MNLRLYSVACLLSFSRKCERMTGAVMLGRLLMQQTDERFAEAMSQCLLFLIAATIMSSE